MVDRGSVEMNGWFEAMMWIVIFGTLLIFCDKINR